MKKVVISCGCIPARLDSVKFITNRFKGGLAFKTAKYLLDSGFDVTIVKWKYTELPENLSNAKVIDILDVFEYYDWYDANAQNYDAFVMAGAVANLTPSNPYKNKFPSHNYQVGEKFNIEFEIAPRAIDIIKKKNPKATLVGYKLFDADSDEELVKIATTTLKESKANIIFANTPKDAKTRKIALTLDGSHFEVSFDEHLEMIKQAINLHFFKTVIVSQNELKLTKAMQNKIELAKEIVKKFEQTIDCYGTVGIKIDKNIFVTTSRGHLGDPVVIKNIDFENKLVYSTAKATLNAPTLALYLKKYDYVIHRHEQKDGEMLSQYVFPGTVEECDMISQKLDSHNTIIEPHHGYISGYNFCDVDWNNYYNVFPKRYFVKNEEIENLLKQFDQKETLEVGGNKNHRTKYVLDKYVSNGGNCISYDDLENKKFDLIVIENAMNYITTDEIKKLQKALSKNGLLIANTFNSSPSFRIRDNEFVFSDGEYVNHYLFINEEKIIHHKFFDRDKNYYQSMGFEVKEYGKNSLMLKYKNNK